MSMENIRPAKDVRILKKDGVSLQKWKPDKILWAAWRAANRAGHELSEGEKEALLKAVVASIDLAGRDVIPVADIHRYVETALMRIHSEAGLEYKAYRNYKQDFGRMISGWNEAGMGVLMRGDAHFLSKGSIDTENPDATPQNENSNVEETLVSSKRALTFNEINKSLYMRFNLTVQEREMHEKGVAYIHDASARRDTMNCCLCDVASILKGGFEMGNMFYSEPTTISSCMDVIGDIVLSAASQQYGGFTVPRVDRILAKYCDKSMARYFSDYHEKYLEAGAPEEKAEKMAQRDALAAVRRDLRQGFQGWEYKFNTVASSRGDYPFVTMTMGEGDDFWSREATLAYLEVREGGQGKKGRKRPPVFPKLVFLYNEDIHGKGMSCEDVFEAALRCSSKTMYPDFLSLSGEGYVADMYRRYGKVVSPMGCRAFLSPWWERGGMEPADENDVPVFEGRFNLGVISLFPALIYAMAKRDGQDYFTLLEHYMQIARGLHLRTREYLGEMKASMNPLCFCEGGFYGGHLSLDDKIRPVLDSATASFGYTGLAELQVVADGRTHRQAMEDYLYHDGEKPITLRTLEFINKKCKEWSREDKLLYAVYGTPAEGLCGKQPKFFLREMGPMPGVTDKAFTTNSFHQDVREDITPVEKQDLERPFWEFSNGGKIQYVRYPINYNMGALKTLVRRAMSFGYYEGINMSLAYCEDCGHRQLDMDTCPVCGSRNLTKIDRMNGYLSFSRVHGKTRLNAAKMAEIAVRKSM